MSFSPINVNKNPYLLVVEDSDEDFSALERVLDRHCNFKVNLQRCLDGDEAIDFMNSEGDYCDRPKHLPSLMLLDLNLPGTDGREVLKQIKNNPNQRSVPIVVFTTSSNPKDVETCYQFGANSYVIKPMDVRHLKTSICSMVEYWFEVARLPELPA